MSFFSKKENEELFSLLNDDDGEDLFADYVSHNYNPNALTPEEVSGFTDGGREESTASTSALEALKKRMLNPEAAPAEESKAPKVKPEPLQGSDASDEKTADDFDLDAFSEVYNRAKAEKKPETVTDTKPTEPKKAPPHEKTLLEKCRPFILDGESDDSAMKSTPTYKLESVAEILKSESQKTLDRLSEKYDISFDDLGKSNGAQKPKVESKAHESAPPEREVFEDLISSSAKISQVQTNVSGVISDIDSAAPSAKPKEPDLHSTATIKFTPVSDENNTARISISSQTRPIDLTGELTGLPEADADETESEVQLEQTEFEEYIPDKEFSDEKDAKRFLRELSLKKRSAFLRAVFSVTLLLLLAAARLPFMSGLLLAHTKTANIICTAVLGIISLINADMFKSIPKILSRRSNPDICASFAALSVLAYGVTAVFKSEIALDLIILGAA
ncbi:MAG: hypothetical protein ACI4F7_13055, partial [Acutalibacteraceae bacterium]